MYGRTEGHVKKIFISFSRHKISFPQHNYRVHESIFQIEELKCDLKIFLLTVPRRCFFRGSFLLFMFRVCHAFLSVHCSLVITCWERANLLALLYVMFSCVIVTFPCGVLGQVWYLIVSIPDLCLLTYFKHMTIL